MKQTCWKCGSTHENKKKLISLERCPTCDVIAYTKPEDEGFLHHCQEQFIISRAVAEREGRFEVLLDPKSGKEYKVPQGEPTWLAEMFPVILKYARRLVRNLTAQVHLSPDEIEDKTLITAGTMLRYYITKPSFKIEASFGAYLRDIALQPCFNKKDKERDQNEQSLNVMVHGGDTELGDVVQAYAADLTAKDNLLDYDIFKEESIGEVIDVIKILLQSIKRARGAEDYLIFMKALRLEFDEDIHPKKRAIFWERYRYYPNGDSREALFDKTKFVLLEGLKTSLGSETLDPRSKNILNGLLQTKRGGDYY